MKLMVYGNSRSSQCNNFALMYERNFHGFPLPIELAVRVSSCTFSSAQATAHSGLVVLNNCSLFSVPSITLFLDFTEHGEISPESIDEIPGVCRKGAEVGFCVSF